MNKTNSSGVPAGRNSPMAPLEEGLVKLGIHGKDTQIGEGKKACPSKHPAGFGCSLLSGQNSSSAQTLSPLIQYIEEIELFNPTYGLVKVQDRRELIVKHILDSLAPISILRCLLNERQRINVGQEIPSIADVGSGAGLPGIPLAICMPGADFTLIERMGRRAGFLRNTLAVLGLSNARVEETEMENFTPGAGGGFDLVVFRAFRPLEPAIFRGLLKLLAPNGILAAYKGRRESLEQEMAQVYKSAEKGLCPFPGSWEALPLDVPFLNEERHLLLIRQNSS